MTILSKDMEAFLKRYPIAIGCGLLTAFLLVGSYIRSDRASEVATQLKDAEEQGKVILKEIQSGQFAKEFIDEYAAGKPKFEALRKEHRELLIEQVGKKLRDMMAWIKK